MSTVITPFDKHTHLLAASRAVCEAQASFVASAAGFVASGLLTQALDTIIAADAAGQVLGDVPIAIADKRVITEALFVTLEDVLMADSLEGIPAAAWAFLEGKKHELLPIAIRLVETIVTVQAEGCVVYGGEFLTENCHLLCFEDMSLLDRDNGELWTDYHDYLQAQQKEWSGFHLPPTGALARFFKEKEVLRAEWDVSEIEAPVENFFSLVKYPEGTFLIRLYSDDEPDIFIAELVIIVRNFTIYQILLPADPNGEMLEDTGLVCELLPDKSGITVFESIEEWARLTSLDEETRNDVLGKFGDLHIKPRRSIRP